jgi:hypothetical protein
MPAVIGVGGKLVAAAVTGAADSGVKRITAGNSTELDEHAEISIVALTNQAVSISSGLSFFRFLKRGGNVFINSDCKEFFYRVKQKSHRAKAVSSQTKENLSRHPEQQAKKRMPGSETT